MDELQKKLTQELIKDGYLHIQTKKNWTLPVHCIQVKYETVHRSQMDIFMKILLQTVHEGTFTSIQTLAEVLFVEPLFIEHMMQKMERAQVIKVFESSHYCLTKTGIQQLQDEEFIEAPEQKTIHLYYSSCHQKLLHDRSMIDIDFPIDDEYCYYDIYDKGTLDDVKIEDIETFLISLIQESSSEQVTQLHKIVDIRPLAMDFVPCIEFCTYDNRSKRHSVHVWNNLINDWDTVLMNQIEEQSKMS